MKISTNNIGNYSPNIKPRTINSEKFNVELNQNIQMKKQVPEESTLTMEEKNYFRGLYPESSGEIEDYHFYQKSGKMAGVTLGSQIDRRG